MQPEEQDRFTVVLVRARNPANIGAVARAMHDLGYADLRIVNEYPVPFEAAKSAVHAEHVLEQAQTFTSLAEALADCTLVLGTTAVGSRVLEHPLYPIRQAVPVVQQALAAAADARVALLFGSEKTGLSNDELSHCHALVTIPMNTRTANRHLSMNLGQAAAVCLYELAQGHVPATQPAELPATGGDLERLTGLLQDIFTHSGYERRHPANARPASVRRLLRRAVRTAEDATVWTGILRQILHAVRPGHESNVTAE